MTDPTQARLEEIRRRLAAATQGEWSSMDCPTDDFEVSVSDHGTVRFLRYTGKKYEGEIAAFFGEDSSGNLALVMNAPQDLQWCIARIEELEEELRADQLELATAHHVCRVMEAERDALLEEKEKSGD